MNFLRKEIPEAEKPWSDPSVIAAGWICLALVLIWIIHRIWLALFLPWWFNTDEVVIYYESVRQLRLDFSQTFFDIPGTPFMSLTTILTFVWWIAERIVGLTKAATPGDFAFANAQGVFTLMRGLTLGMYATAVALAYDLFRRCAGALIAVVAALLFASLPIFVEYSYFVRTETMGLVLCLAAIWIVLYSRWKGTQAIYGVAGALAGAAMAARFHFALVGLPVILLIFFLRDRERLSPEEAPESTALHEVAGTVGALFFAGALIVLALKTNLIGGSGLTNMMMLTTPAGPAQYSGAKAFVAELWLALGFVALLILLVYRMPQGRRRIRPIVNPFTLLAVLGFMAGFVLSNPEFLWRGEYQLRSIQFYSDWTDVGLTKLGPIASWWNVNSYYFTNAFPERWTKALFLAGAAIILWKRRPIHLALAGGAAFCFFAHPLRMKLWPHHVIPWLPLLCFVAAVPAGLAGSWLVNRYRHTRFAAVAVVLLASGVVVMACSVRLEHENEYLATSKARTDQILQMNRWLSANVPPNGYLLESYFSLNEDGFREWIESAGVPVPAFAKKHSNVHIWWLDRSSVDGHAGIMCTSRADMTFFHDDFERKKPGSTYNPFENANFKPIAHFGSGFYELSVFRFDCQSKSCSL
jgi:hypothetical protein